MRVRRGGSWSESEREEGGRVMRVRGGGVQNEGREREERARVNESHNGCV